MEENQNLLTPDLQIDATSHAYLSETAKWCNFLSILGFIISGIIAIFAIFAGTLLSSITKSVYNANQNFGATGILVTIIYLIIAAVNFVFALYLYRFASKMKIALNTTDQNSLNNSFLNLKNLYKLASILAIIYLAFLVLAFIFGIGAALMR